MTFRAIELSEQTELHIHNGILDILHGEDHLLIPVSDISIIIASGANIRLSTNDLSVLAENDVLLMTVDRHYYPSSMTLSFVNNSRQSLTMKKQMSMTKRKRNNLWNQIISAKIRNQAKVLDYLQKQGFPEIYELASKVNRGDRDHIESQAAAKYFQYYYPGLNRRCEDPVNSCLNYGYAVIRSAVARSAAIHGFLLSDGIHHRNTFNPFNLVDDIMEPYRPMADLLAYNVVSSNVKLTKEQRKTLMSVLYMDCRIGDETTTVINAIDKTVSSIKAALFGEYEEILMPSLSPVRIKGGISE